MRLSEDGDYILCEEPSCSAKIKNHMWGQIKAESWLRMKNGDAYCPKHLPEWTYAWRLKNRR